MHNIPLSFNFWQKYLKITAVLFCLQGLSWCVIGSLEPFGWYDSLMSNAILGLSELPADAQKIFQFILIPFGATDAAYFMLFYFVVEYPLKNKEKWAWNALVTCTFFWFAVDTVACLFYAAYFNILMVNIPSILVLSLGFFGIKKYMKD